jgi:cellulose synthase/poly-beta-1,6-N-acetylglucosamine synthase-like glycosyltransferase
MCSPFTSAAKVAREFSKVYFNENISWPAKLWLNIGMILNLFPDPDGSRAKASVIVPVLNESETIGSVVEFARRCPLVDEVIVVDDGSTDGTPELARTAGANVVTSTMLGKGASMEDGMRVRASAGPHRTDGPANCRAAG